jgi:hypothetical protein
MPLSFMQQKLRTWMTHLKTNAETAAIIWCRSLNGASVATTPEVTRSSAATLTAGNRKFRLGKAKSKLKSEDSDGTISSGAVF